MLAPQHQTPTPRLLAEMMDWAGGGDEDASHLSSNPSTTDDSNKAAADSSLFANRQQFAAFDNYNTFHSGPNFSDVSAAAFTPHAQHPYTQPLSSHNTQAPFTTNAFANYGQQQGVQQYHRSPYDPALVNATAAPQNFNLDLGGFPSHATSGATIAPRVLEHEQKPQTYSASPLHPYPAQNVTQSRPLRVEQPAHHSAASRLVDQIALAAKVPSASDAGIFRIINFDTLARATNSERMGNFLNVGKDLLEWDCTRSAIPTYTARRSRNQLKALAGGNFNLLTKISKKSSKDRPIVSAAKTKQAITAPAIPGQTPQTTIQVTEDSTSSEEDSSSDDDSEYSTDNDSDSPLPSKRPEDSKGAVEYDTIKALWRSKRRVVDSPTIRKGLVEFWEIIKTIRDRWKNDATAVTEAEEKKRVNELPLLKSRVKDQRDMIEAAFKTAYKHGHRAIIELMAENVPLVFLCYQFLLDRMKNDDINGPLARAILETMSVFTTLTAEKLEKTHLAKVLKNSQKKADAKTRSWVKRILSNSEDATKEATAGKSTSAEPKPTLTSVPEGKASPTPKRIGSDTAAGVKRPAPGSTENGTASKKIASAASKTGASVANVKSVPNGVVKTAVTGNEKTKTTAAANTAATVARKTVVAKPSGFFSSLQSATKKPGTSIAEKSIGAANGKPGVSKATSVTSTAASTKPAFSFAETMANLSKPKDEKPAPKAEKEVPAETNEERAKRLRKEQRRKLRVSFRTGDDLEQIRYFTHDPAEDNDHDSSQLLDVADIGGEGRAFKEKSRNQDVDEDDDVTDEPEDFGAFKSPNLIDFSEVEEDERKRNYAPHGGGETPVESEERAVREQYENNTLIVFYTDSSQVPPNPRELADSDLGQQSEDARVFGKPEAKYIARAHDKSRQLSSRRPQPTPIIDFAAITNMVTQQAQQQAQRQQQAAVVPPPVQPVPDIQAILATLRQSTPNQPTYPTQQPPVPEYVPPAPATAPPMANYAASAAPTPVAAAAAVANIDLAAILASLNSQQQQQQGSAQSGSTYSTQPPAMTGSTAYQSSLQNFSDYNAGVGAQDSNPAQQHRNYKTRVCKYWLEGKCIKGTDCSFIHEQRP